MLNAFGQGGKICTDPDNLPPPVMGVVGTVSSQTSITVASLLRLFRLPQVSYGATSPDLSNRDEYRYFTRTVPSDDCQAEALVEIIIQLGWSGVFLISSSGNYGERIRERFVALVERKNDFLCIVDELKIGAPGGDGSLENSKLEKKIKAFLERINKRQSVRGMVLLTETIHTYTILKVVKQIQNKTIQVGRFRWLATDTWGVGQDLRGVEDVADGAISIALHRPRSESLKNFYRYFRALRPRANPRNPWFDMFWESYFQCAISENITNGRKYASLCNGTEASWGKDGFSNDDKVPYVFDAVYALAHSLDAMLRTTNKSLSLRDRLDQLIENEIDLIGYLKNTSFTGKSGNVRFDENGDGMPRYDIMSYEKKDYSRITVWKEGNFSSRNISWFEKRKKLPNQGSWCSKECEIGEGKALEMVDWFSPMH